jgi:hypothetical protein
MMRFGAEGAAVGAAAGVCCAGVAVEAGTAACACAYIASLVSSSLVSLEFTNLGINIYIYIYMQTAGPTCCCGSTAAAPLPSAASLASRCLRFHLIISNISKPGGGFLFLTCVRGKP